MSPETNLTIISIAVSVIGTLVAVSMVIMVGIQLTGFRKYIRTQIDEKIAKNLKPEIDKMENRSRANLSISLFHTDNENNNIECLGHIDNAINIYIKLEDKKSELLCELLKKEATIKYNKLALDK